MSPQPKPDLPTLDSPKAESMDLEPGDFYYEGPFMVFTAQYLLKRGYCCGSGCRHCPY
jgi:hypothetical protein